MFREKGDTDFLHVSADRGSIAAGRDLNFHLPIRPCSACEVRLIAGNSSVCGHCQRAARAARVRRDGTAALAGFGICTLIGMRLAHLAGLDQRWVFVLFSAAVIFGSGYLAWVRLTTWLRCELPRRWRVFRRRLARGVTGLIDRAVMRNPIRRVPGSEREKAMERNEAETARLIAQASKLIAEAGKANAQARWYPVLVAGLLFAVAFVVAKFVL